MSRLVRRSMLLAALALAAVPFTATVASGQAIPESATTFVVKKVVVGAGAPSAVTVTCEANPDVEAAATVDIVLTFDAAGNPVSSTPQLFDIVDGAFVAQGDIDQGGVCTYTETSTGGATSTSFTCTYDFNPVVEPGAAQVAPGGCSQASGAGVGPVQVTYPGANEVLEDISTVVFTNTFTATPPPVPAAQVVAQPAFTG